MRFLYFLFYWFLNYSIRLYFRRIRLVNATKKRFSSTIFVSNHPSAFMDPLIISVLRKPIVFFMTRSDVFNKWTSPILSSAHMIPIYRQHDGGNSAEKNKESFRKATEILSGNRGLLIFGEGLTDDVFERRLKPLKKGALRIGFTALEATNWEQEVRLVALGCNYANPNVMRSDLLISESNPIILNDYKDQYLENPSKTINELNRQLESALIDQITHVQSEKDFAYHEQIMMLTRKGMNPYCFDEDISLEMRWRYSQELANFINQIEGDVADKHTELKHRIADYFHRLRSHGMTEQQLYDAKNKKTGSFVLPLLYLLPFAILGCIHAYIPTMLVKRFAEKTFKRKVFWCSTKMVLTMVFMGIFNLPLLFVFPGILGVQFWYIFTYYLSIGMLGLAWYQWRKQYFYFRSVKRCKNALSIDEMWEERERLLTQIEALIPVNIS